MIAYKINLPNGICLLRKNSLETITKRTKRYSNYQFKLFSKKHQQKLFSKMENNDARSSNILDRIQKNQNKVKVRILC